LEESKQIHIVVDVGRALWALQSRNPGLTQH
jgi:hypothetical protein